MAKLSKSAIDELDGYYRMSQPHLAIETLCFSLYSSEARYRKIIDAAESFKDHARGVIDSRCVEDTLAQLKREHRSICRDLDAAVAHRAKLRAQERGDTEISLH